MWVPIHLYEFRDNTGNELNTGRQWVRTNIFYEESELKMIVKHLNKLIYSI